MDKKVAIHRSFDEADQADKAYYQQLTSAERLDILLELNKRWPVRHDAEADQRLARVYRITLLSKITAVQDNP